MEFGLGVDHSAYRVGSVAVLHIEPVTIPLHIPFVRCTEYIPHVSRLAVIMIRYADLRDEELITHSLNYGALMCPFDQHRLLTNIEY